MGLSGLPSGGLLNPTALRTLRARLPGVPLVAARARLQRAAGPVASALLALAEHKGMNGREVVDALVLGIDVACRLGNLVPCPGVFAQPASRKPRAIFTGSCDCDTAEFTSTAS